MMEGSTDINSNVGLIIFLVLYGIIFILLLSVHLCLYFYDCKVFNEILILRKLRDKIINLFYNRETKKNKTEILNEDCEHEFGNMDGMIGNCINCASNNKLRWQRCWNKTFKNH